MSTNTEISEPLGAAAPDDSLNAFCADLRQLRDDYPSKVSLGALVHRSGIPKSTLSSAFNGKKMPTERTLSAVVAALDGNVPAWLARRERLRLAASGVLKDVPATSDAAPVPEPEPAPTEPEPVAESSAILRPRWLLVILLVLALLLGGAIGAGATWGVMKPRNPLSPGIVKTGDDPALFPACLGDAITGAAETRLTNYLLEVIWSANCRAGWGRVTRYDNQSQGNQMSVTAFLQADPNGPSSQTFSDSDSQSIYTNLIATHSVDDRICVKATVTDGGQSIDLGAPLCL